VLTTGNWGEHDWEALSSRRPIHDVGAISRNARLGRVNDGEESVLTTGNWGEHDWEDLSSHRHHHHVPTISSNIRLGRFDDVQASGNLGRNPAYSVPDARRTQNVRMGRQSSISVDEVSTQNVRMGRQSSISVDEVSLSSVIPSDGTLGTWTSSHIHGDDLSHSSLAQNERSRESPSDHTIRTWSSGNDPHGESEESTESRCILM
jgi:hypothetical protein